MFNRYWILTAISVSVLLNLCGCQLLKEPDLPDRTAVETARKILPAEVVTFDVLLVNVPYYNRYLVDELWHDVDEQELDWEIRKKLRDNGFRTGIIGASVPESLSRLLALKGLPLRTSVEEEIDPNKEEIPAAVSKPVTLSEGRKSLIELREDVVPCIPVLSWEEGQLIGQTYQDARTFMSVGINKIPDGSVEFELTPLVRFGSPQMVAKYKHAQLVRSQEQPSKTFDDLKSSHALRPGQFLVVGSLDENTRGLGHYFFTKGSGDLDQKLLVIRLMVTQHDEQFSRFPGFQDLVKTSVLKEKKKPSSVSGQWMPKEISVSAPENSKKDPDPKISAGDLNSESVPAFNSENVENSLPSL